MKVLIVLATLEVTTIEVDGQWLNRGYVNVPRRISAVALDRLGVLEVESPLTSRYDCYAVGKVGLGSSVRPALFPVGMRQDIINHAVGEWLAAIYDREVSS